MEDDFCPTSTVSLGILAHPITSPRLIDSELCVLSGDDTQISKGNLSASICVHRRHAKAFFFLLWKYCEKKGKKPTAHPVIRVSSHQHHPSTPSPPAESAGSGGVVLVGGESNNLVGAQVEC